VVAAPLTPGAEREEAPARPGVIAHRGVVREAPENTRPAIAKAIELGCALAEIDLRYTSDGEIVLMHDPTVDRTTDGQGRVADKTLAEIRALDAGAHAGPEFRGTRVPTLREAVEQARGHIGLYLDLKEADPRPVVRLIEELGARPLVFYRPYSHLAVSQILAASPQSRLLVDLGDWLRAPGLIETLRHAFPTAALSSDWPNWTPEALAEARAQGMPTFVNVLGTHDTPENLRRAVAQGFDYIQTDHARELLATLRDQIPSAARE
jgi:glycerophosphoryl diester phosphodiesterase